MKLCSACLLGIRCLYNRRSKPNAKILELAKREVLIPVCPEQLGGLPTPRAPSHKVGEKVINNRKEDVTKQFERGSEAVLEIAKIFGIREAILKQSSPSCGSKKEEEGVTTLLLRKNGIKVISEKDF